MLADYLSRNYYTKVYSRFLLALILLCPSSTICRYTHRQWMSLGTGALMVGREPERLRHSKEVSTTTLRAGTTPACSRQPAPSHWRKFSGKYSPDPYLPTYRPKKGRDGVGARIRKDSNKTPDPQRSAQNASMRCNVSHKISNVPSICTY